MYSDLCNLSKLWPVILWSVRSLCRILEPPIVLLGDNPWGMHKSVDITKVTTSVCRGQVIGHIDMSELGEGRCTRYAITNQDGPIKCSCHGWTEGVQLTLLLARDTVVILSDFVFFSVVWITRGQRSENEDKACRKRDTRADDER